MYVGWISMLIRERSFVVGDAEGGHPGGATWRYLGGTLAVPLGAVLVEQLLDHGGAGLRVHAAALDLVTPLKGSTYTNVRGDGPWARYSARALQRPT